MSTATRRLTRRRGGMPIDRNRSWDGFVDGSVVGEVAPEQTVELPVEPGRHTLRLHSGWHVAPGQDKGGHILAASVAAGLDAPRL